MGEAISITKAVEVFLTILVAENRQQCLTTRTP
jgi:hypothetical protein